MVARGCGEKPNVPEGAQPAHAVAPLNNVTDVTTPLKALGSSIELCETDYKERTRVCCFFFQEFERKFVPQPFNRANAHLFRDK